MNGMAIRRAIVTWFAVIRIAAKVSGRTDPGQPDGADRARKMTRSELAARDLGAGRRGLAVPLHAGDPPAVVATFGAVAVGGIGPAGLDLQVGRPRVGLAVPPAA